LGRTVEKYSKTKNSKKSQEQHITQSLLSWWELGRTVEKYLRPNTRKESQKSSTSLNPCFLGGIG
jgi:hypothetical protein